MPRQVQVPSFQGLTKGGIEFAYLLLSSFCALALSRCLSELSVLYPAGKPQEFQKKQDDFGESAAAQLMSIEDRCSCCSKLVWALGLDIERLGRDLPFCCLGSLAHSMSYGMLGASSTMRPRILDVRPTCW